MKERHRDRRLSGGEVGRLHQALFHLAEHSIDALPILFNLVEEYGEGIDRMFSEMEERLMGPPHFTATESSVTVTLFHRSALSIDDQAWLSLLGHIDLSPQERRILVHARHGDGVTPRQLRRIFGEEADVEALLQGSRAKGLLTRVGRGGGVRHVLSDEGVRRA